MNVETPWDSVLGDDVGLNSQAISMRVRGICAWAKTRVRMRTAHSDSPTAVRGPTKGVDRHEAIDKMSRILQH